MARSTEPVKTGLSFAEYLALERSAEVKHEFVHGQLFMMAGASDRHNRLAGRLYARLLAAESGDCRTYISDMLVRTPDEVGYYPDVLVTCEEGEERVKRHPCLIIEVLSPTTEAIDRGEKLHNYQKFASLEAYVLVSQEEERIEMFRRDNGGWRYEPKEAGESLTLPCAGLELTVEDIYIGL